MRGVTCSKFSNFGTPRSKFHAFGTPQPGWDPSRATTRACTRGDPSRSGMATRTGRAQRRSALPQHATRRRRGPGLRRPRMPRHPERPAPQSSPPPGRPLALTACETARCQCQSTAGQRQGAGPRSVFFSFFCVYYHEAQSGKSIRENREKNGHLVRKTFTPNKQFCKIT